METYRKTLIDRFVMLTLKAYDEHCEKHKILPNASTLITFLIDQDVLSINHIKRYTIVKDLEAISDQHRYKTDRVAMISDKYNISERTVWNIIKSFKRK